MMIDIAPNSIGEALAQAEDLDDQGVTLDVLAVLAEQAEEPNEKDLVALIARGFLDTTAHRAVPPFLRRLADALDLVAEAPDRRETRELPRPA